MSRRGRLLLFGCAGSGLLAVLVIGLHGLPPFGDFHGAYGLLVDRLEPGRRHATDIVTALNFDLRAFDTLGEEFILFASVTGVALLLRHLRDEDDEPPRRSVDDHRFAGASDALRVMSLILIPLLVSLGVYLALHGALTPGGGFQAGVVLAAGPLAILLAGRYLALKRVAPQWALEALDGIGALAYAADRPRRPDLRLGIPGELPAAGHLGASAVGRDDAAQQHRGGAGGDGRVPAHLDRVPGPGPAGRARRAVMAFAPFAAAAWLFVIGLYGVVSSQNLVRTVLSLTVVQSSTYLVLLGVGYRHAAKAPIVADIPTTSRLVDPVTQVLVLTDVVIEATVIALLLALVVQAHKRFGSVDPAKLRALRD